MAAIAAHRLAINPYGDRYPDDNSVKEITLEADGLVAANPDDRHVLLHWVNGTDVEGCHYTQTVHLTGGPGNYSFHTPQVKRDQILTFATAVKFDRKSYVNNCQTWMRDLLEAMVGSDLLSKAEFEKIDISVPLIKRVPEASGNTT